MNALLGFPTIGYINTINVTRPHDKLLKITIKSIKCSHLIVALIRYFVLAN